MVKHSESARQMRLSVDGLPLIGATPAAYALQAAAATLSEDDSELLARLRDSGGPAIGVLAAQFDDVPLWLDALGLTFKLLAGEDLPDSDVQIAFVACPHRFARLDQVDLDRFLDRGGILVTSDRAALLEGVATYLPADKGRAPRRARLNIQTSDCQLPDSGFTPPVWLHHGYRPLDLARVGESDLEVLATDSLTGEPLVVRLRAGEGTVLHSVPHWMQADVAEYLTAADLRPLSHVSCYAAIGNSYPELTLGSFLAAQAMLRLWLAGIGARISLPQDA